MTRVLVQIRITSLTVLLPVDFLLAGVPQKLKFTVTTGHYRVKEGDTLQLSNADTMLIIPAPDTKASVYQNSHGDVSLSPLTIHRSDKVTSIALPPAPPYHLMEFELDVVCLLPETGRLLNGEVPRRGKDTPDSRGNVAEQRVSDDVLYITTGSPQWH
ncbi:unnamed protein product [Staurois parvus]|uniref:TRAPPC10 Ig-like domain-containing protein n=1 Tax=Staurois parvus TaxID=386267 RepID=A0ABN9HJP1_9NEOB|nr:unnamed protein product [Staurois parvus]